MDFLGFIFVKKSPRYITPGDAAIITSTLHTAQPVGVFMNQDIEEVIESIRISGMMYAQLHGQESPQYCLELKERTGIKIIKNFGISGEFDSSVLQEFEGIADLFLFDTEVKGVSGGIGKTFDWTLVEKLQTNTPWLLAGGLGPENISKAIRTGAHGLDLNSKLESAPGIKEMGLVEQALKAASKG